jgi:hypothetical protein
MFDKFFKFISIINMNLMLNPYQGLNPRSWV